MNQDRQNTKWRTIAQAFIRFAIPDPDTTPEGMKNRGRIIYAMAIFVLITSIGIAGFIGKIHQESIVKKALALHSRATCHEDHGKIIVICISRDAWNAEKPEVHKAWIEGEAYANPSAERIVIGDETRKLIVDVQVRPAGRPTKILAPRP